ncbi:MAG: hypothetical protein K0B07_00835 [DPANN group archaeon]|nr:hypothetical protein [DPANN group archaeon]
MDNPFFDESDETCLNGLIQKLQRCDGDENIEFSDYRGALKFATKSMTNNKTLFLEDISNQDMSMYNKGFVLDYFHEGGISPFYSKGVGFKINVMVNNIYIDDMRVVLNGVAARKLGSEVWV